MPRLRRFIDGRLSFPKPNVRAISDPGNAGAIPVTQSGQCALVTGGAETRTLAAPSFIGQELTLYMKTDVGDCVVTCATTFNEAGDTTLTFSATGQSVHLVAVEEGSTLRWRLAVIDGATVRAGVPNTGVTAVEKSDGYSHTTTLTVSQVDALTTADLASIADGYLLYTFPAGAVVIDYAYMSMGITATVEQQADTPDVGLGTVIASGAVAVLGGTGTFEDIITGQTAADANGTATVKTALPTAGVPFIIASGDAHTLHFNVADAWADDTSADLSADIAGTVVIVWHFLA